MVPINSEFGGSWGRPFQQSGARGQLGFGHLGNAIALMVRLLGNQQGSSRHNVAHLRFT